MLEDLRAWLNGDRDYFAGVLLYAKAGDNDHLKSLFARGKTDYCNERLQAELLKICRQLKAKHYENSDSGRSKPGSIGTVKNGLQLRGTADCINEGYQSASATARSAEDISVRKASGDKPSLPELPGPANEVLFQVCKQEADKAYKEVMNLRAELFAMARADDFSDPNTPDRIQQRSKLAVKVADDFKRVSLLYDRADHVKLHGRLPDQGEPDDEELDTDGLPDHLVKTTLDNLRKNFNKMKKREQTPERVALLQKHEANITKLQARWLLLKPAK